jgi:hypothetical protein
MFIPDPGSDFFHPGRKDSGSLIPDPHQRIKVFLTRKIVSKLSETSSGMFIPDPDFYPSRIPDPAVKKALDPGFRIRNTAKYQKEQFIRIRNHQDPIFLKKSVTVRQPFFIYLNISP